MTNFDGQIDMTFSLSKAMRMTVLGGFLVCPFKANAEMAQSQQFISDLYQAHKALTDVGQPGVIKTPGLPLAFFTSDALAKLNDFGKAIHPLTGAPTATLKEVRVAPDSNPDQNVADHIVVVRDEKGLRALRFRLISENGSYKISNISGGSKGAEWSLVDAPVATLTNTPPNKEGAAEAQPTAKPQWKMSFEQPFMDTFDGAGLSDHWKIRNEDPDRFIVENGEILFVATGDPHSLTVGEPVNEISIAGTMPDENYSLSIRLRIDSNLVDEKAVLALRNGEDDFLAADLFVRGTGCGPELILATHNSRQIREEEKAHHTYNESRLLVGPFATDICGEAERAQSDAVLAHLKKQGATLSLVRQGHLYRAQIDMEIDGQSRSYQSPIMVRFEPMANPTIYVGKESGNPGSGNVFVSHFEFQPE